MKRLLFFICTLLCANVLMAQTRFWIGDLQYEVTSTNPPEVMVYDANQSIVIANIPQTVNYNEMDYTVTSIGNSAFSWCTSLTNVFIPNTVTSIGNNAFADCTQLLQIVCLSNTPPTLGNDVFYNTYEYAFLRIPLCSYQNYLNWGLYMRLQDLDSGILYDISDNNEAIVAGALASNGYDIVIPDSITCDAISFPVTAIKSYAFSGLTGWGELINSITIGNNVTSIGHGAFEGCSSLTSIDIPNSVTTIESEAFKDCSGLTSVTIGNGVTLIGSRAFEGCSSLTTLNFNAINCPDFSDLILPPIDIYHPFKNCHINTIYIGDSVQRIPACFAYGLSSLTSVTIGNNVTSIGDSAFLDCSSLTTLNFNAINCNDFNNGVSHPFRNCPINTINIGDSVQRIPDYFAYNLNSLPSITIPNSVTSIGDNAFNNCSGLTSVTLPNSVTFIGNSVFSWCSSLTSVTIPNSVTSIGDNAFNNCSSLTSITIPNSVTSIGDNAFNNCSGLTSVTLPNNATIHQNAFFNAGVTITIDSVTYSGSGDAFVVGNYTFTNTKLLTFYLNETAYFPTTAKVTDCDMSKSGDLMIPSTLIVNGNNLSVTFIGYEAFYGCSSLTSVTIPNSVIYIGDNAFEYCSNLTSVTIPNSVTSIGNNAFSSCSNLTTLNFNAINCNDFNSGSNHPFYNNPIATINIGDSVQRIPNYFAYDLDFLTSITIPNSVTSIGDNAFNGCRDLTSVTCLGENPSTLGSNAFLDTPLNKVLYFPFCSIENYATSDWSDYFDINIKEGGLTYVYNNNNTLKVINCDDTLTSVVIPSNISNETCSYNVTEIGNNAFYNSSNLTSITIGNNITSINDSAFYGCSGLTTLNFNAINCNDFNSNNHPFANSPISTITIGDDVQRIPNYFAYNNSLIPSVNVPNSVTEIGTNAFNGCINVLSISLGNSVASVEDSAFYGCSNITSVDIPNSVTEIGADAFNGCDMLMLVNLGENLSFIGSNAFNSCTFLQSVNCLAAIPPTLQGSSVFPNPNTAILTVPCGSLEAYSSPISFWNILFNGRIEEDCEDDSSIEQAEETLLSFYPNPTDSKVTFSQAIEKVEVIDLTGKTIFTFTNAKTINIESLPSGAYYLRLTNDEKTIMQKVIKQ